MDLRSTSSLPLKPVPDTSSKAPPPPPPPSPAPTPPACEGRARRRPLRAGSIANTRAACSPPQGSAPRSRSRLPQVRPHVSRAPLERAPVARRHRGLRRGRPVAAEARAPAGARAPAAGAPCIVIASSPAGQARSWRMATRCSTSRRASEGQCASLRLLPPPLFLFAASSRRPRRAFLARPPLIAPPLIAHRPAATREAVAAAAPRHRKMARRRCPCC